MYQTNLEKYSEDILRSSMRYQEADKGLIISERHRHRFEFNNLYRPEFESHGFIISGTSPDGSLVEMVELADHPFMVATQAHPEFKARPTRPHPLMMGFIKSCK
jgi:CTP synthase